MDDATAPAATKADPTQRNSGRPPIGKVAMTAAERKRRSRALAGVRQIEIDAGVRKVMSLRAADHQLDLSEFALAGVMAFDFICEHHPEMLASILKHCKIRSHIGG